MDKRCDNCRWNDKDDPRCLDCRNENLWERKYNFQNLKPIQENPNRRTRLHTRNWKSVIKSGLGNFIEFKNPFTGDIEEMSVQEAITLKQMKKAVDGDLRAAQWLSDRTDGKPVEMTKIQNMSRKVDDKEIDAKINALLKLRSKDAVYKIENKDENND